MPECPLLTPVLMCTQINGKKLRPARGAFARFMVPLMIWWVLAVALYGASFTSLTKLQAPLTSLQVRFAASLLPQGLYPAQAGHCCCAVVVACMACFCPGAVVAITDLPGMDRPGDA